MEKYRLDRSPKIYDWLDEEKTTELFIDEFDAEEINGCMPDCVAGAIKTGSHTRKSQTIHDG